MRALIVGYGSIGQRHLRNLCALVPEVEPVLLVRDVTRTVAGASSVGDLATALAAGPELAIVATPSSAHIESLLGLVGAGIPTYVEKPVVTQAAHVEAVRQALAVSSAARHVTGYNLRLLPSLIKAQDLIRQGRLGTVVRASFSAGQWLPDWRKGADFRLSYSSRKDEGGGVIFDLSHELDSARFLLGELQIESCLTMNLASLGIAAESAATISGRAQTGALVSVNIDYVSRRPLRRYELVGDKASLVWDLSLRRLELHNENGVELVSDAPADFDVGTTYLQAMTQFISAVRTGVIGNLQTLEDGLRSTELAIQASVLGRSE